MSSSLNLANFALASGVELCGCAIREVENTRQANVAENRIAPDSSKCAREAGEGSSEGKGDPLSDDFVFRFAEQGSHGAQHETNRNDHDPNKNDSRASCNIRMAGGQPGETDCEDVFA